MQPEMPGRNNLPTTPSSDPAQDDFAIESLSDTPGLLEFFGNDHEDTSLGAELLEEVYGGEDDGILLADDDSITLDDPVILDEEPSLGVELLSELENERDRDSNIIDGEAVSRDDEPTENYGVPSVGRTIFRTAMAGFGIYMAYGAAAAGNVPVTVVWGLGAALFAAISASSWWQIIRNGRRIDEP